LQKLLYSLFGLLLLPALAGLGLSLYHLLVDFQMEDNGRRLLTHFLLGGFSWLMLFLCFTRPIKSYILAHELTHLFAAWLTGVPAGKLTFHRDGGSVQVARTTLWISLAPYFIPFYCLLILLAHTLAQLWQDPALWSPYLPFALGFTWSYHLCFTLYSLTRTQSDIRPYGLLGAYPLIAALNLVWLCLAVFALNSHSLPSNLQQCWEQQKQMYVRLIEFITL
jgi:hypothetical protein